MRISTHPELTWSPARLGSAMSTCLTAGLAGKSLTRRAAAARDSVGWLCVVNRWPTTLHNHNLAMQMQRCSSDDTLRAELR
nr:hypothetical protein [Gammaproteobacteria bacterium]